MTQCVAHPVWFESETFFHIAIQFGGQVFTSDTAAVGSDRISGVAFQTGISSHLQGQSTSDQRPGAAPSPNTLDRDLFSRLLGFGRSPESGVQAVRPGSVVRDRLTPYNSEPFRLTTSRQGNSL